MSSPTLPTQASPPEFAVTATRPHALSGVEVIALPVLVGDSPVLGPGSEEVEELLGTDLLAVLEADNATGKTGEITTLPVPLGARENGDLRQVLLVGLGEARADDFRRAGAALARAVFDRDAVATTIPAVEPTIGLEPFVVGATLGSFAFAWRKERPEHAPARRMVLAGLAEAVDRPALTRAVALGGASWRARTLASVPSNLKSPAWLADQAVALAEDAGLEVTVWDEKQLADEGFGGVLGVGQASATPPRLIRLDYTPRQVSRRTPTVVLVGKGITFDTGGLTLKPHEAMVSMKRDMTGGAVVMSVLAALADVDCPVKVVGLVPAAENAVSGNALRPGDVISHYGGRTTEVTNTDAEGRLVMADAMAWAVEQVKPDALVDVATLTGAMRVALGTRTGGFFANRERLAANLRRASVEAGEPLWRFPLTADYESNLSKSQVADADNAPGGPGAIIAALFLQHFVDGLPWAHVDIASVGDSSADVDEWTQGPTGFGPRALLTWLADPTTAGVF